MNRRSFLKLVGLAVGSATCIPLIHVQESVDAFDPSEQVGTMRTVAISGQQKSEECKRAVDSAKAELMEEMKEWIPAPYRKYVHWDVVYYENGNAAHQPSRNIPLHSVCVMFFYHPNVKAPTKMTYHEVCCLGRDELRRRRNKT